MFPVHLVLTICGLKKRNLTCLLCGQKMLAFQRKNYYCTSNAWTTFFHRSARAFVKFVPDFLHFCLWLRAEQSFRQTDLLVPVESAVFS